MMGDSGEAKESKPGDMKGKSLTCPPGVSAVCVAGYTVAAGYAWLAGVSPLLAGLLLILCLALVWLDTTAADTSQLQVHWRWALRESSSNGVWCCGLLPLALTLSAHAETAAPPGVPAELTAVFALGSAACCLLVCHVALHDAVCVECSAARRSAGDEPCLCIPFIIVLETPPLKLAVAFLIFAALVVCKVGAAQYAVVCALLVVQVAGQILLPRWLPRCFSLGESALCSQAFCAVLLTVLYQTKPTSTTTEAAAFGHVALLSGAVVVCALFAFPACRATLHFYALLVATVVFVSLPCLYIRLGDRCVLWLWHYVTERSTKARLVAYWAVCAGVALAVATASRRLVWPPGGATVPRKLFHLVAVAAFAPGLASGAASLLTLASTGALVAFVLAECVRVLEVEPFHRVVDGAFRPLLGRHDNGPVILSHVYLLTACALPLWLVSFQGPHMSLYAGLLSVGIGDAVASVGGTLCGRNRWPGSVKTVEGTVISISVQLLFCWLLVHLGWCLPMAWTRLLTAVVLTSLLEAFTTQIDNLVLPLFMFSLLVL